MIIYWKYLYFSVAFFLNNQEPINILLTYRFISKPTKIIQHKHI